jgi:hypothetical protein
METSHETFQEQPTPPPEKTELEIYELLDAYRTKILEQIKNIDDPKQIFATIMHEVKFFLRKKELPIEMREEIRRLVSETFDVLREISPKIDLHTATSEEIAKRVIEDTKHSADLVLPETKESETAVFKIPTSSLSLHEEIPDLVLPPGQCGYKGGVARIALKKYAMRLHPEHFDKELLDAELPLSDRDAVVGPNEDMWNRAQEMGVDADGVERLKNFDVRGYMDTRDLDMNEVLLTKDFLYFTPAALESVLSGVVHGRERGRSLFGADSFFKDGKLYLTNRMIHRLVKVIVEGKANSFEIPKYNTEVRLGIYWLVLIRKAMGKKNQAERIAGIFSCARQMKQTETSTPEEFLIDLCHQYPFFSFEGNQNPTDTAKWVVTKYVALIHKHLRQKFGIHPGEWDYTSTDETLMTIVPDIAGIDLSGIDELVERVNPSVTELTENDIEFIDEEADEEPNSNKLLAA